MADELRRMLESHAFLKRALDEHGHQLRAEDSKRLQDERDAVFWKLLSHRSSDPHVLRAQIGCMLEGLVSAASDRRVAERLKRMCLEALDRLIPARPKSYEPQPIGSATSPSPKAMLADLELDGQIAVFNRLSDRVVIVDPNYRYLFANEANARYRNRLPTEFVGQPIWSVTGDRVFAEFTKPMIDRCIAQGPVTGIAVERVEKDPRTFLVTFDPVQGPRGETEAIISTARDITDLRSRYTAI